MNYYEIEEEQTDLDKECLYCNEPSEYNFCDNNCEKAWLND